LVESLKITIKKPRPDGTSTTSFPSGHAALGFIGAITIHRMYGVLFASPLYFFATTSAFARVKMNKHDDIDIIGGIAVSILSYWLVNYLYIRIREIVLNKIS
jgi:membrane-associated phospholipid phosphatase